MCTTLNKEKEKEKEKNNVMAFVECYIAYEYIMGFSLTLC
jgi:hypothetical protein